MNPTRPSPAGQLFDASAVAVKKLEALALTLGKMTDIIRELTVRPLTATQREIVIEAFKSLDGLDPLAHALNGTLARLRAFAADIDEVNRNGR